MMKISSECECKKENVNFHLEAKRNMKRLRAFPSSGSVLHSWLAFHVKFPEGGVLFEPFYSKKKYFNFLTEKEMKGNDLIFLIRRETEWKMSDSTAERKLKTLAHQRNVIFSVPK